MYLCFIDYQEEEKDQISIPGNSDKTYKEKVIIYTNCLTGNQSPTVIIYTNCLTGNQSPTVIIYTNCLTGKPESPTVHSCKWLS